MNKPLEEYKAFIDALVKLRPCVSSRWVREKRAWPDNAESRPINDYLEFLTEPQRELLAQMLQQARDGGIHDTLVYLSDEMNLKGLRFVRDGQELPVEPFGTEMYYDWVCRCEGDSWPDTKTIAEP